MVVTNQLPDLPTTNPNTINIVRTSDFVQHVRPPPPGIPLDQYTAVGSTRNDCVLSGLVIVHLSKPKRARYLQVEHITTARLPASLKQLEDPSSFKGWGSREVNRTAQCGQSSFSTTTSCTHQRDRSSKRLAIIPVLVYRPTMARRRPSSQCDGIVWHGRRRHPRRCRSTNVSESIIFGRNLDFDARVILSDHQGSG